MVHYRFGNKSKIWRAAIDVSFTGRAFSLLDGSSRSPGSLSSFTYPVVAADSADAKLICISMQVGLVHGAGPGPRWPNASKLTNRSNDKTNRPIDTKFGHAYIDFKTRTERGPRLGATVSNSRSGKCREGGTRVP